jgi:hypothetical protein
MLNILPSSVRNFTFETRSSQPEYTRPYRPRFITTNVPKCEHDAEGKWSVKVWTIIVWLSVGTSEGRFQTQNLFTKQWKKISLVDEKLQYELLQKDSVLFVISDITLW